MFEAFNIKQHEMKEQNDSNTRRKILFTSCLGWGGGNCAFKYTSDLKVNVYKMAFTTKGKEWRRKKFNFCCIKLNK